MNEGQALESKATQLLCAQCGSRLTSSDDGEKFCIHCLLRSALGQDDIDPSKTLRRSDQLIPGDNGAPIEFGAPLSPGKSVGAARAWFTVSGKKVLTASWH